MRPWLRGRPPRRRRRGLSHEVCPTRSVPRRLPLTQQRGRERGEDRRRGPVRVEPPRSPSAAPKTVAEKAGDIRDGAHQEQTGRDGAHHCHPHSGVRYIGAITSQAASAVGGYRQAAAKTGEPERVPGRCRLRVPPPLRRRCRTWCREARSAARRVRPVHTLPRSNSWPSGENCPEDGRGRGPYWCFVRPPGAPSRADPPTPPTSRGSPAPTRSVSAGTQRRDRSHPHHSPLTTKKGPSPCVVFTRSPSPQPP